MGDAAYQIRRLLKSISDFIMHNKSVHKKIVHNKAVHNNSMSKCCPPVLIIGFECGVDSRYFVLKVMVHSLH